MAIIDNGSKDFYFDINKIELLSEEDKKINNLHSSINRKKI